MNVTRYTLTASGNITLPTIQHNLHAVDDEHAKRQAPVIVAALSKAGYGNFTLFVHPTGTTEDFHAVETYSVEETAPVVTAHKPRR
jgi:hypothetical protein